MWTLMRLIWSLPNGWWSALSPLMFALTADLSLKCRPVCPWSSPPSALTCTCPPQPWGTHPPACTTPCPLVTIATSRPRTGWWQVRTMYKHTHTQCHSFIELGCMVLITDWLRLKPLCSVQRGGWEGGLCSPSVVTMPSPFTQHRRCSRPVSHRPVFCRLVACPILTWSTEPTHYKVQQPLNNNSLHHLFMQLQTKLRVQ